MKVTAASAERYVLAEGPQFNPDDGSVSWVDIEARTIQVALLNDRHELEMVRTITLNDRVGCAFPISGGRFLAGIGSRIGIVDPQGAVEWSRELLGPGRRFNDGIIDPRGRLIVGSMSLDERHQENLLLRLEHDGSITTLDDEVELANGMGFSPDRSTFYSVDSLAHVIYARDYDADNGTTGPRTVLVRVEDAEPDGIAVDGEGDIWVALWRGHGIRRFGPDGTHKGDVTIGAPHVTSLCFRSADATFPGADRGVAVVTTASIALTESERSKYPDAGRLFLAELGVSASPTFRWHETALPV